MSTIRRPGTTKRQLSRATVAPCNTRQRQPDDGSVNVSYANEVCDSWQATDSAWKLIDLESGLLVSL